MSGAAYATAGAVNACWHKVRMPSNAAEDHYQKCHSRNNAPTP